MRARRATCPSPQTPASVGGARASVSRSRRRGAAALPRAQAAARAPAGASRPRSARETERRRRSPPSARRGGATYLCPFAWRRVRASRRHAAGYVFLFPAAPVGAAPFPIAGAFAVFAGADALWGGRRAPAVDAVRVEHELHVELVRHLRHYALVGILSSSRDPASPLAQALAASPRPAPRRAARPRLQVPARIPPPPRAPAACSPLTSAPAPATRRGAGRSTGTGTAKAPPPGREARKQGRKEERERVRGVE